MMWQCRILGRASVPHVLSSDPGSQSTLQSNQLQSTHELHSAESQTASHSRISYTNGGTSVFVEDFRHHVHAAGDMKRDWIRVLGQDSLLLLVCVYARCDRRNMIQRTCRTIAKVLLGGPLRALNEFTSSFRWSYGVFCCRLFLFTVRIAPICRYGEKHFRTSASRHGPKTSSHEFCPSLEKKRVNQVRIGIIWWNFRESVSYIKDCINKIFGVK